MESLGELSPSRYLTFTYPNPLPVHSPYSSPLQISILDSPLILPSPPPTTATIFIPPGRESDWTFSTPAGHLSLLLSSSSSLSRLILIGSVPRSVPECYKKFCVEGLSDLEDSLSGLLLALCPKSAFGESKLPRVSFLEFEDSVVSVVPKEVIEGPAVGEMIVEDVAVENSNGGAEFRRRLRFKRMPNLIQTQVLLFADSPCDSLSSLDSASVVRVKKGSLVQPYLAPMVAGLSLISHSIMGKFERKIKPRCLCIGVGGGDLLMCLRAKLGFDVVGVELDLVVVDVAKRHFELVEDEFLGVHIGDGIQIVSEFALKFRGERELGLSFDAIMVDLDTGDVVSGVKAPPLEFLGKDFLLNVRSILCENGVFVINVIPPLDDRLFLESVFEVFNDVFAELYRLDVECDENFVLFAIVGKIGIERKGEFIDKLEEIVGEKLIRRIRKIGDIEEK